MAESLGTVTITCPVCDAALNVATRLTLGEPDNGRVPVWINTEARALHEHLAARAGP